MPRRFLLEVLAVVVALAVGAAGARYTSPYRVEQVLTNHDVIRLTETQHVTNNITNVTTVEQKGQKQTHTETKPDGTKVEDSRIVWDNTTRSETAQKLTLDLASTTAIDHTATSKTVTTVAPSLTLGLGVGGPFGVVPAHFDLSIALFGSYRVGEVFKVPISAWGLVSLQPPTFVPNAAFGGVAISL